MFRIERYDKHSKIKYVSLNPKQEKSLALAIFHYSGLL